MTAQRGSKPDAGTPAPIYVVYGKDRRQVTDQLVGLRPRLLGDADPQLALSEFEGDQVELADVLDELRTLPFLAARRVVVVKDADGFITRHRAALEAYLDKPSPTGVLVLAPTSFPGNTRLAKKAAALGQIISCEPVKPRELPGYLAEYARGRHDLELTRDAAAALIELAGEDAGVLVGHVDKIAAFLADPDGPPARRISVDLVSQLVGNSRHYNAFNVIDAMIAGDVGAALGRLEQMLAQDRSAQFTAVGAFAWHLRRLYQARLLLDERRGDREIIKELRIWSQPQEFMAQVRRLPIERLAAALRALARIDYDSKTGGSVRIGLERLIVSFGRGSNRVA